MNELSLEQGRAESTEDIHASTSINLLHMSSSDIGADCCMFEAQRRETDAATLQETKSGVTQKRGKSIETQGGCSQVGGSSFCNPTKRRRRFRRRNSVIIQKEHADMMAQSLLCSLDEDLDDDHHSMPDFFESSNSRLTTESYIQSLMEKNTESQPDNYEETGRRSIFHTSWSNSDDTRCYLELSSMSISSVDPTDSSTSFTASTSDLAGGVNMHDV
jgi:hypothetical protein